jgi:elongation factor G
MEEDPSLKLEHAKDTHQMVLWGQGEMHLRVALERLKRKYGVEAVSKPRQVPYKETIRKGVEDVRGRHKKQSGGHGQFGDVVLDIKPLPRGSGFLFEEKITGGVVPRSYIPSVEIGVQDFLQKGPLGGFPVVDVSVTLTDGSYHSVDLRQAFRQAGRIGMSEGMPQCVPSGAGDGGGDRHPSDATARQRMIPRGAGRSWARPREGRPGWDLVRRGESEMADLMSAASTAASHHTAGSTTAGGVPADNVLAAHKAAAEER